MTNLANGFQNDRSAAMEQHSPFLSDKEGRPWASAGGAGADVSHLHSAADWRCGVWPTGVRCHRDQQCCPRRCIVRSAESHHRLGFYEHSTCGDTGRAQCFRSECDCGRFLRLLQWRICGLLDGSHVVSQPQPDHRIRPGEYDGNNRPVVSLSRTSDDIHLERTVDHEGATVTRTESRFRAAFLPPLLARLQQASRRTRSRCAREQGSTIIEMSLTLLILLAIMFGLIEICLALYTYHFISDAAREGTRYAIVHGSACMNAGASCTVSTDDIQTYVEDIGFPGIDPANMTVTTTYAPYPAGANLHSVGCVQQSGKSGDGDGEL